MKKILGVVAVLAAVASTPALAQQMAPARPFEVAPFVGGLIATGHQKQLFDDTVLTGLTLSYDVNPYMAVVGSVAWAPTETKKLPVNDDVDLFQYDLGLQGQYRFHLANGLTLKPFAGAGLGGRTYSFRDLDVDNETDFVGYVALGAGAEYRKLSVSLTARDFISAFDGIGSAEDDASAHNEIGLFASVGLRF
jgi:hypothetical protein